MSSDTVGAVVDVERPWVEKWRPQRVEDVSCQEEVIRSLTSSIDYGNIPHLLFHGPPGTGKTTTILAVAKQLYSDELFKSRVLELNASDERGIQVVREKIKMFAQGSMGNLEDSNIPRFKLIILDEADTMTPDAQSALRRIMEVYSHITRFCLVCNYVTRIIEPLASRCAKFRFQSLTKETMHSRLSYIAQCEKVSLQEGTIDSILNEANGDMRKAVTYLQSCHQFCLNDESITKANVIEISGGIPIEKMTELWSFLNTNDVNKILEFSENLVNDGYCLQNLIRQVYDNAVADNSFDDLKKALICEKLSITDHHVTTGANELIQMKNMLLFVGKIVK